MNLKLIRRVTLLNLFLLLNTGSALHRITDIFLIIIGLSSSISAGNFILNNSDSDTLKYISDTVVVSESLYEQPLISSPFAIDRLSYTGLENSGHISLDQVLQGVPGIIVNNRFNASQGDRIVIRGLGSRAQFGIRGIKIILDNIPLTFPDGQTQLNNLDLNSIGSVEIIRGPSAFLYGNSAGGLIYIKSKTRDTEGYSLIPEMSFGKFDKQVYSLSGNYITPKHFINLTIKRTKQKGYRENSAYHSDFANVIYTHEFNENFELTSVFNYNYSPYLLNPSSLDKADYMNNPKQARTFIKMQGAGKRVEQLQGGLNITYTIGNNTSTSLSFYGIKRDLFNSIPGSIIKLNRVSAGFNGTIRTQFSLYNKDVDLLFGIDYSIQEDDRREFDNNGLEDYPDNPRTMFDKIQTGNKQLDQWEMINVFGVFGKISFGLFRKTTITVGQRLDSYIFNLSPISSRKQNMKLSNWSPMIGLSYNPIQQLTIYSNYSTAFQTPTFNEISNNPNPGQSDLNRLKPEKIHSIELGLRGWYEDFNTLFSFTLYGMSVNDMLIPYQLEDSESWIVYYRNSGKVINRGIETSLEWLPANFLKVRLTHSFINSEFEDYLFQLDTDGTTVDYQLKGNDLPGIPQHTGQFVINYSPAGNLEFVFSTNYSGSFYTNDFNGQKPGEYGNRSRFINDEFIINNLFISYNYTLSQNILQIFAGINNLFNTKYSSSIIPNAAFDRYFEPGLPRYYYAGFKLFLSPDKNRM